MEKQVIKPKIPLKVNYEYAGKESLLQTISKSIPKELTPTKKTGYAFGAIFTIVVVIALLKFPVGAMITGDTNISIKVGIPMTFLDFSLMNPEEPPTKFAGLIIDLLLYLILSYAIDVTINLVMRNHLIESSEINKERPKIFKDKEQSKTVAEKIIGKPPEPKQQIQSAD